MLRKIINKFKYGKGVVEKAREPLESMGNIVLHCPECHLNTKVFDCLGEDETTPDDDDGNLCCPICWYELKKKVIMEQMN